MICVSIHESTTKVLHKMGVIGVGIKLCFFKRCVAIKIAVFDVAIHESSLFAAGVFGNSFGSLTDGVLGQFTRQQETDSSLDFTG